MEKKLICIDNSGNESVLTKGKEYYITEDRTIGKTKGYEITDDKGRENRWFKASRFIEKTENMKKILICVDPGGNYLTKGKEYTLIEDTGVYYEIINDKGSQNTYKKSRFIDKNEKIVGYRLVKDYPGRKNQIGTMVSAEDKLAPLLPECFQPVYESEEIKIGGYIAEGGYGLVRFGCKEIPKAHLEFLIRFLGDSDIKAVLTVKGEQVTVETLQKVLNLIK